MFMIAQYRNDTYRFYIEESVDSTELQESEGDELMQTQLKPRHRDVEASGYSR